MSISALQKSTIVRTKKAGTGAFFRTAEVVAPRLAGRVARDLWFTVPPGPAAGELPEGGEPFEVTSRGTTVRGHVWGSGPVVYLVHGWGGRGSQMSAFVEPLVEAGHQVVLFDGPSHGDSDPGRNGPTRTHGMELGQALDEVFARFGPAHAVIAHSLGTIATYLTLRFGWLSTERLVLVAPMVEAESLFDFFQSALGFGPRTRRAFDQQVLEFVGLPVSEFDARVQAAHADVDDVPTLIVHDRKDPQTPYGDAVSLLDALPDARLITTTGLGHRRILSDPDVVSQVVDFIAPDAEVRQLSDASAGHVVDEAPAPRLARLVRLHDTVA
jgi:pimeloyl-ACP methyl ester carboxylesterase